MKSNLIMTLGIAALFSVLCLAGAAAEMEIRWHRTDGETKIEYRPINELDGVAVFRLERREIIDRKVSSVELTPDFARAKKGDKGFWVVSSGETGTFRCDDGTLDCNRWQLMSFYGMQTPERTFVAIVRKLKYYFTTRVVAENGVYRMSCVLENELASHPYEDLEIEFRRLEGEDATLPGMARAYRRHQLDSGAVKPLAERIKENEATEVMIATNATVEGETTAMYISRLIKPTGVKITRLAYGIPVGADIEYADKLTLLRAIEGRREF